jgi:hypothetical protein
MSHTDSVYHVYVEETGSAAVESPIESEQMDFFDSGVWAYTERGREFYPYERVQVIREVDASELESEESEELAENDESDEPEATDESAESDAEMQPPSDDLSID